MSGEKTILLVDDEEMILEIGGEMLRYLGYAVWTAPSGEQALARLSEKADGFDLVILDLIMPDISAQELFNQLSTAQPDLKVLLSSGYSLDSQGDAQLARQCSGFIQKPFNLEQISQKIREILKEE